MDNSNKISILLADDHRLFRSGIREILTSYEDIFLAGEAENGKDLVELYFHTKPDVILVDISMPEMSGIEALKEIKSSMQGVKALFLSMYDSEEYIFAVLMADGLGLINKNIDKDELHFALKKVYAGERYFKDLTEEQLDNIKKKFDSSKDLFTANYHILTNREKKILRYISEGLTSAEIAKKLKLGKRTIDTHRADLISKLNLRSLPDLIKYAIQFTIINKSDKS